MIMFEVILLTTAKNWGVTSTFVEWGAWLYQSLGIVDVSTWPYFADKMKTINAGFINDPGSMRNLGIIIGALISPLLAGHFSFKRDFKLRDIIFLCLRRYIYGIWSKISFRL